MIRLDGVGLDRTGAVAQAVRSQTKHALRGGAENLRPLAVREACRMHDLGRLRVADREWRVRAEHDTIGACFLRQILQRISIEYARIKIHGLEALAWIGILALRDLVIAREPPERERQRRAAV